MPKAKPPVAASQQAPARKLPKKLIPRTAPKAAAVPGGLATDASGRPLDAVIPDLAVKAVSPAPSATSTPAPVVRAARKPSKEDALVAKHQKVLAEALVEAQAISYAQPVVMRQAKEKTKPKAEKPVKAKKIKLVRDCFAMPEHEYAGIVEIKQRLSALGRPTKKSEVLRAGIAALARLSDADLSAVMAGLARIKTGRPAK